MNSYYLKGMVFCFCDVSYWYNLRYYVSDFEKVEMFKVHEWSKSVEEKIKEKSVKNLVVLVDEREYQK